MTGLSPPFFSPPLLVAALLVAAPSCRRPFLSPPFLSPPLLVAAPSCRRPFLSPPLLVVAPTCRCPSCRRPFLSPPFLSPPLLVAAPSCRRPSCRRPFLSPPLLVAAPSCRRVILPHKHSYSAAFHKANPRQFPHLSDPVFPKSSSFLPLTVLFCNLASISSPKYWHFLIWMDFNNYCSAIARHDFFIGHVIGVLDFEHSTLDPHL